MLPYYNHENKIFPALTLFLSPIFYFRTSGSVIEGSKPYKKKDSTLDNLSSTNVDLPREKNDDTASSDAMNPDRRAWFGKIIPTLGTGLVKLLRESNHLKEHTSRQIDEVKKNLR